MFPCIVFRYLEPLKEETFLSSDEVVRLVGNIQQIVHFQKEFLRNLEESVDDESFVLYTAAYECKVRAYTVQTVTLDCAVLGVVLSQ